MTDISDIIEILSGYFYMTIDNVEYNANSRDSYFQKVARIYSQREIETEEFHISNKLKEELTQEFRDIAKAIIDKIKEKENKVNLNKQHPMIIFTQEGDNIIP